MNEAESQKARITSWNEGFKDCKVEFREILIGETLLRFWKLYALQVGYNPYVQISLAT